MQHATQEVITSGVNEGRFLEHLRTMFSTSTTVLAELMQNARRAGATTVGFSYDEPTKSLIVTDNGCGIADFRALITVAESGWSEETMQSDKPFGMGFFSVAFGCESVLIESRGRQTEFSSDDLIAKRPIIVRHSSFIGATRLTLRGCRLAKEVIASALRLYAEGFAIPVWWDEQELPRPYARENLPGVETAVGFVSMEGVHRDSEVMPVPRHGRLYCQGLPIKAEGFTRRYADDTIIIHVDHQRYQPRMPDRECLVDGAEAANQLNAEVCRLAVEHLFSQKAVCSPESFAEKYWDLAADLDVLHIMNDVPVLPKLVLDHITSYPIKRGEGDSYMSPWPSCVHQHQVLTGEIVLCSELDEDGEGDQFAKLMYVKAKDWCMVTDKLPDGHWANPHIRDLEGATVRISGKVRAVNQFQGRYTGGTVKLFDRLVVVLNDEPVEIQQAFAVGSYEWSDDGVTFLIPYVHRYPSDVLRQGSTYTSNDIYQETDLSLDEKEFDDLVAIMAGETPEETLTKCLKDVGDKSNLRNTAFTVSIDAEGKLSILKLTS